MVNMVRISDEKSLTFSDPETRSSSITTYTERAQCTTTVMIILSFRHWESQGRFFPLFSGKALLFYQCYLVSDWTHRWAKYVACFT